MWRKAKLGKAMGKNKAREVAKLLTAT